MHSTLRDPVAAVRAAYAKLRAQDDSAIFISLKDEAQAVAEAEALRAAGPADRPLYGLTFAVKDNIDVAGLDTTAACPAFAYRPDQSAEVVRRLEAAGAIAIGKTNLDQFATGLVGVRSPYGVPRNALRADLIPGGSSSGSAVAVATGIVDFSLGTDTAGSGRIPAGMNGIVGLKPSVGLLSATGMLPACRTLDTISVFARDVALAVEVTAAASGYDAADPYSRRLPVPALSAPPPVVRVGVPKPDQLHFFGDDAAAVAFSADLETLVSQGAAVVEVDFEPLLATARLLYEGPWVAERYAATKPLIETEPEAFHPTTLKIIGGARSLTAVATFEAIYRLAELRRTAEPILASVDCLAVPTVPRFYTVAEVEADPVTLNSNLGTYTNFVNLLDLAAISVPVGKRTDGLPSSLTLISSAGRDGYLAGLAAMLHGEISASGAVAAPQGRIELAVVGAHLSGLPLNQELTKLGGTFVRTTATARDYRLFALPNTAPPKPGLLRVATGTGVPITVEVWALEPSAFGAFVAAIPGPLGIGTVTLADGTEVKGFLVEAVATEGARDISQHGGWRNFLAAAN